jgi:hypothetical protein
MKSLMTALLATAVSGMWIAKCEAQSFGFATFSALVNSQGRTVRGLGVQSSARSALGVYTIEFTREVDSCFIVATPRGANGGQASVQEVGQNPNQVRVRTFSRTGQSADLAFVVLVSCAS